MSWDALFSIYMSPSNRVTHFSTALFATKTYGLKTHSTQQGSALIDLPWHTHDEHLQCRSSLGGCNTRSGTGTAARENALRYLVRRHPDDYVFRRLEQRLLETESAFGMQVAFGLHGHQPMKMPWMQMWNESCGEANAMSRENWDYLNRGSSKYLITINCVHTTTSGAHIYFQAIVLYECNFSNGYINMLRASSSYTTFCGQTRRALGVRVWSMSITLTSGQGIIILISTNVITSPLQGQGLGWYHRDNDTNTSSSEGE
jgi:hypothetical protein